MPQGSNKHIKIAGFERIKDLYWPLIFVVLALSFTGVAMQYSAAGGAMDPWAGRQLSRLIAGIILMFAVAFLDSSLLLRFSYHAYFACIILLIVVEIIGHIGMGAQRWVKLGELTLQPSEITKLCMILALARYFHVISHDEIRRPVMLAVPLMIMLIPAILILNQPNLGTATIVCATAVGMFFAGGVRIWKFALVGGIGLASLPVAWTMLHDYQKRRVLTFLDPEADPLGAGYNIMQSKIAIGSGGLFGKGFLEGSQSQLSFLPEKQTDFVFTMLAEEFGLVGGLATLGLFSLLILMGIWIATSSRNHFGRMVAIGVTIAMFMHLFINVAMVMGMIPVVGIPLPLLSYGGSMLITALIGFGLILNVHMNRYKVLGRSLRGDL